MKIVDFNVSVGGFDSYGNVVTAKSLLDVMNDYHIDYAVCYNEHALLEPKSGNEKMRLIAAESGGKIGVSVVLDPVLGAENLPGDGTLVERLSSFSPKSIHIFPEENRTAFYAFYWDEILDAANTLGLPVVVDYEDYPSEFFVQLPDIAQQYPNAKFVLVRYGICCSRHVFPLIKKCKNVYFTTETMLDNNQLEEICERAGADKLIFATSWPKLCPSGALGLALYANISKENREKILYNNLETMQK